MREINIPLQITYKETDSTRNIFSSSAEIINYVQTGQICPLTPGFYNVILKMVNCIFDISRENN